MIPQAEISYIYVMGMDGGPTKVGRSSFPERRRKQIEAQERENIFILGSWPAGAQNAFAIERYVHWLLRDKHYRREWFNASFEEICTAISKAIGSGIDPYYLIPSVEPDGKPATYPEKYSSKFTTGALAAIEGVLDPGENRAEFIRASVNNEISRRTRRRSDFCDD